MRPRMADGNRVAAVVLGLGLAAALAGCGDPDLWARHRAQRGFWKAGREVERIRVNPRIAGEDDYARAAAAFRDVAEAFPPDRWATPGALTRPYAADIATLSGRSAVAAVRFGEGRHGDASEAYEAIAARYAEVPVVRREALSALARERYDADHPIAAAEAWIALWGESDLVDARRERIDEGVLEAPFGAARALRLAHRGRSADSLLHAARLRLAAEAVRWHDHRPAPELWWRAVEAGTAGGDPDGAIEALRGVLGEAVPRAEAAEAVLAIAARHVDAGRPDSALVYTAWARTTFDMRTEPAMIGAEAWERLGKPDSALVHLKLLVDDVRVGSERWVRGRSARAELLARIGRWEQARGEYRALIAGAPTHALAFRARSALVAHHARLGQEALARIEGQHALEAIDRLLEISRDDSVQVGGRRCRAEIHESLGELDQAFEAYVDLWRRYRRSPEAGEAGLEAAAIAIRRGDPETARGLYDELTEASDPQLRARAREALARLAGRASRR